MDARLAADRGDRRAQRVELLRVVERDRRARPHSGHGVATSLRGPLSEIRSPGTPARNAARSSGPPKRIAPRPSSLRIARTASDKAALNDGRTSTGPCGHALTKAAVILRAFARSCASETT